MNFKKGANLESLDSREAGIKYSYTVELPDTGRHNFILPPARISGTVREAARAVRAMAAELLRRTS